MAFEVNFNEYVEVELTEFGVSVLQAKRDDLNRTIRKRGGEGLEEKIKYAEGDKFSDQIWSFMRVFGPYMGFAYPEPFKGEMVFPTGREVKGNEE